MKLKHIIRRKNRKDYIPYVMDPIDNMMMLNGVYNSSLYMLTVFFMGSGRAISVYK